MGAKFPTQRVAPFYPSLLPLLRPTMQFPSTGVYVIVRGVEKTNWEEQKTRQVGLSLCAHTMTRLAAASVREVDQSHKDATFRLHFKVEDGRNEDGTVRYRTEQCTHVYLAMPVVCLYEAS